MKTTDSCTRKGGGGLTPDGSYLYFVLMLAGKGPAAYANCSAASMSIGRWIFHSPITEKRAGTQLSL